MTTQQNSRFKTVDLSAFAVNFELANVGAPDLIVSDNEGISLSMNIPRVKFKLAVDGDLGEMFSGNFDSTELSLTTNALRQTLLWPMTSMMQSFSDVLVNGVISLSGITSPTDDTSVDPYSIPISTTSFLNEEFQIAFNGPMTIHMPKGIRLLDLESSAGYFDEPKKVDGRQEITYNMPCGNVEDTIAVDVAERAAARLGLVPVEPHVRDRAPARRCARSDPASSRAGSPSTARACGARPPLCGGRPSRPPRTCGRSSAH